MNALIIIEEADKHRMKEVEGVLKIKRDYVITFEAKNFNVTVDRNFVDAFFDPGVFQHYEEEEKREILSKIESPCFINVHFNSFDLFKEFIAAMESIIMYFLVDNDQEQLYENTLIKRMDSSDDFYS